MTVGALSSRIARLRPILSFLASFGAAKGAVVVAPLILAGLVGRDAYGAFEWSIGMGQLGAAALSGLVANALPVLMLQRNPPWLADVKALGLAAIAACCGALALALLTIGRPVVALAACAVVFVSAQQIAATFAQARGRRDAGLLWSGFATVALVCLFAAGRSDVAATAWTCLAGVGLVALASGLDLRRSLRKDLADRFRRTLATGAPLVGYGLAAVWLASSGRVFIGFWLGLGDVATYGLGFRLASLLLLPHAVFTAAFFVRLFQMRARAFDRFASTYLAATAIAALALTLAASVGLPRYGALWFKVDVATVAGIFPLLSIHVLLWIATATLSSRISRLKLGFPATLAVVAAGLAGVAGVAGLGLAGGATLRAICVVVIMQEGLHLLGQVWVLRRRKMAFPRILTVVALGCASLAGLALLS